LPTAEGDNATYILSWYAACEELPMQPFVQKTFVDSYTTSKTFKENLLSMDAIIVSGGNTLNMLAIWKAQGIDTIQIPGYYTPGLINSNEPFIPFRIGYEFKIFNEYEQANIKIDLAYQYNMVFGDNVDGFTAGNNNDVYVQYTIGVKFAIGSGNTSYKKQIPY